MTVYRAFVFVVMALLCAGMPLAEAQEELRAFPEAEGFGAFAKGGRGGLVIAVTALDDYVPGKDEPIPGSLRAAKRNGCPAAAPPHRKIDAPSGKWLERFTIPADGGFLHPPRRFSTGRLQY